MAAQSALGLFRTSPRFAWLMGAFTLYALSLGAREITRLGYIADSIEGEFGIGVVATIFALFLAVSNVFAGRLMDARDPRPFLVGSLVVSGALSTANAWALQRGPMSLGWLLATTTLEAITFGVATPSLLKVQAAVVPPESRGAAETVNILRNGVGAALGTVVAGVIGDDVATLVVAGALCAATGAVTSAIVAPVSIPASASGRRGLRDLVSAVRSRPPLQRTVTIDLVLAAVLPTQVVALVIVDLDAPEIATLAFTASLLGVLAGRLTLTVTGLSGSPTRRLRVAFLGFTAISILATPALIGGWIIDRPALVAVVLFTGSATISFAQSLPIAILQQQVPDEFRGSLSGAMNAARSTLIGVAAVAFTVLTYVHNSAALAGAVSASLVLGYLVAGRFRGLTASADRVGRSTEAG